MRQLNRTKLKPMKHLFLLLIILIFSACKNEKAENNLNNSNFTLNSFKKLPKEIDGCSCVFSKNEKEYQQNEFIFASNFDSIGFVSINNEIIKLKLKSRIYKPNTTENEDYTCIYEVGNYKITVEIKADKTKKYADESWWNKGLITIENKKGEKTTQKFIGESGC
jgi:hypothetical protein